MRRGNERIRQEELADIYSSLQYFTKYYDDAESEIQTVLRAIKETFEREYPSAELEDGFYFHNRRNAGRKSKLTEEDRKELFRMRKEGVPVERIADRFNVSVRYVYKLIRDQ